MGDFSYSKGQRLVEQLMCVLVAVALIHVVFFSNLSITYMCLFAVFGILLVIALLTRILNDRLCLITFLFSFFSSILTMFVHGGEGAALTLMCILLASMVFSNVQVTLRTYKRLHFIIALVLSFYVFTADLTWINVSLCYSFLGDRLNGNSLGILALAAFFCWMCYLDTLSLHKAVIAVAKLVLAALFGYMIYTIGCRAALCAEAVFLVLSIIIRHPLDYRSFRRITVFMLTAFAVLVFLAVFLGDWFESINLMGASLLTGRESVWKEALEHYASSPLIGKGTAVVFHASEYGETGSGHNTLVSIMYTLGTVPAISYLIILGRRLKIKQHLVYHRVAQLAFLSSLILSFFESFYTDSHFLIPFLILLLSPYSINRKEAVL